MFTSREKLTWEKGKKYVAELLFSDGLEKVGDYGKYWIHGVKIDSTEWSIFANGKLNDKLSQYTKGDIINIEPIYTEGKSNPIDYKVSGESSRKSLEEILKPDRREIEIKVFASMKIAGTISEDMESLLRNTWHVIKGHSDICDEIEKEMRGDSDTGEDF
tara:strand:- start:691 stop:1170 length:480 start_codon:yes stop_codon:yes gene_type:complete